MLTKSTELSFLIKVLRVCLKILSLAAPMVEEVSAKIMIFLGAVVAAIYQGLSLGS